MNFTRIASLAGVSLLSMTAALKAQEAQTVVLDTITIVSDGKENIEATGGSVISEEDLKKTQPTNVSELFQRESSVTVSGGGGPAKKVHVLGMEQSNLAVTVDGVPQGATSWHHTGSNVVDPVFLKRVEVEAGAAAADSGFGAAAGAIRYETVGARDLLEDGKNFGARLAASFGTNGRGLSGSGAAYGIADQVDYFVMLHGAGGDDYENGSGEKILGTEPAALNVLAKLGYESDGHRFEVNYERSRDEADRLIKMNLGLTGDELHPLEVSRDSVKLSYTSTAATDKWDPEVMVYYSENGYWRPDYANGGRPLNCDMILDEQLFGGKAQNTFTLDKGTITAGVDFGRHGYDTDNYGDNDRQYRDFSTFQAGAFAQGRFEFDNGFKISTGGRLDGQIFRDWDDNDFSGSGVSANGTVSYRFTDAFEVFAGGSRTWLGHVVGDYAYVHARSNTFYTDPNFDPGVATNLKAGANFGGENWNAGVTFFDTRIDGLPEYTGTMLRNNPLEFRSKGVTVNAGYRLADTTFGATYTRADVTAGGEYALPNSGTFMPIGDMATLYVDHEIPDYNLKLGASLAWAGKTSNAIATASGFYDQKAYTVVNAYAEWSPAFNEKLNFRVGVENLFDETYYERSSYAPSSARGGIDPIYAPGRTITFQTAITF